MINKFIGNYRISNFLGRSAGIEIYRATRTDAPQLRYRIQRVLRNGVPGEAFFDAFVALARRLAPLDHPQVLRVNEILFDDSSAYLVSEYVEGLPLSQLAAPKGIVPVRHALGLFRQIADALAAAHAVGLVHGGLTAEHVLSAHDKQVKVTDFGLSTVLRALGLPGGEIPPGVSSDLFALGALLVQLLIGRSPDPVREGEDSLAPQVRELRPALPERLFELVRRLTAVDAAERFGSASEARDFAIDSPSAEPERPLGDRPEMVLIPEGSFRMGSGEPKNQGPVHDVHVPAFKIAAYPVTNRQYRQFCEETGYARPANPPGWGNYFEDFPDHPVVNVRWSDAPHFCNWLSKATGTEYRLPTEAEWEKAARGGLDGETYPWGADDPDGRAHFGGRAYAWEMEMEGPQTRRVASFAPNGYGLYDMAGNVWEWCQDWYVPYGTPQPRGGIFRVARGGSWSVEEESIRCSFRMSFYAKTADVYTGFRCVCAA